MYSNSPFTFYHFFHPLSKSFRYFVHTVEFTKVNSSEGFVLEDRCLRRTNTLFMEDLYILLVFTPVFIATRSKCP